MQKFENIEDVWVPNVPIVATLGASDFVVMNPGAAGNNTVTVKVRVWFDCVFRAALFRIAFASVIGGSTDGLQRYIVRHASADLANAGSGVAISNPLDLLNAPTARIVAAGALVTPTPISGRQIVVQAGNQIGLAYTASGTGGPTYAQFQFLGFILGKVPNSRNPLG